MLIMIAIWQHLVIDDTFLSNSFEDEDNLPVVAIAPELPSDDDDIIDELELDDADNVVKEPQVPSLPRKQGFANLYEVANYESFDPIPPRTCNVLVF